MMISLFLVQEMVLLLYGTRNSKRRRSHFSTTPIDIVHGAHTSSYKTRRKGKAVAISITSVLYLKDEVTIATAGSVDSIIKFWDTRNLKAPITQTCVQDRVTTQKWVCISIKDLDSSRRHSEIHGLKL